MTYQPVIPFTGNAGWSFLSRTREAQETAFQNSASLQRNVDYFYENIGSVRSSEDLVNDRRLLSVALGAFGLDEDIGNTFFIRKVLAEGTQDEASFANRLGDKRYFRLSEAFGFDLTPPNTSRGTFADGVVEKYLSRQFEVAVGNVDTDMRLAVGLDRELGALGGGALSEDAEWFTILGTPPLRSVFESALGLPSAATGLDIDRQLELFRDRALQAFGTSRPSDFGDPALQEDLIRRFLLRSELAGGGNSTAPGAVALSLLQTQASLF